MLCLELQIKLPNFYQPTIFSPSLSTIPTSPGSSLHPSSVTQGYVNVFCAFERPSCTLLTTVSLGALSSIANLVEPQSAAMFFLTPSALLNSSACRNIWTSSRSKAVILQIWRIRKDSLFYQPEGNCEQNTSVNNAYSKYCLYVKQLLEKCLRFWNIILFSIGNTVCLQLSLWQSSVLYSFNILVFKTQIIFNAARSWFLCCVQSTWIDAVWKLVGDWMASLSCVEPTRSAQISSPPSGICLYLQRKCGHQEAFMSASEIISSRFSKLFFSSVSGSQ